MSVFAVGPQGGTKTEIRSLYVPYGGLNNVSIDVGFRPKIIHVIREDGLSSASASVMIADDGSSAFSRPDIISVAAVYEYSVTINILVGEGTAFLCIIGT